jgi:hypothetical protein
MSDDNEILSVEISGLLKRAVEEAAVRAGISLDSWVSLALSTRERDEKWRRAIQERAHAQRTLMLEARRK